MKLLVMNGGTTEGSRTRALTKAFETVLRDKGVEILTFDTGVDILPIYTGRNEDLEVPAVKRLIEAAQEADGFVICTPEYHNGMSGSLKNAIDYLGGKQFKGKTAIIGAACGGGKGGINALNNLRQVLRGVYALVLPDQIVVDPEHFDQQVSVTNEDVLRRIEAMADELIRITGLLRPTAQQVN